MSLVQSSFGIPQSTGNFEVLVRVRDGIYHFWRTSDLVNNRFQWNGPGRLLDQNGSPILASGVSGNPAVIQSHFGEQGNFELAVPAALNGFYYTSRDNDDPRLPWGKEIPDDVELVGANLGHIDSVSLIQSNFGTNNNSPYNFEVIVSAGGGLYQFWCTYDAQNNRFQWNGPIQILDQNGRPVLSSDVS